MKNPKVCFATLSFGFGNKKDVMREPKKNPWACINWAPLQENELINNTCIYSWIELQWSKNNRHTLHNYTKTEKVRRVHANIYNLSLYIKKR